MINLRAFALAALIGQMITDDHGISAYERQRARTNKSPQDNEPKDRSKAKASRKARKRKK